MCPVIRPSCRGKASSSTAPDRTSRRHRLSSRCAAASTTRSTRSTWPRRSRSGTSASDTAFAAQAVTLAVLLQVAVGGLMMGLIYALVAAGLSLIFGLMDVVNFAHGELLMLAMYATFVA